MLSKSPSRPKSETVIGGGLCPDTWATAFNDSYVGTFRSCAFGQELTVEIFGSRSGLSRSATFTNHRFFC